MAAPIQPSNGFITRLLQQTTPAASPSSAGTEQRSSAKPDQLSISHEARQAQSGTPNHRLESKLLELYNQKGEKED